MFLVWVALLYRVKGEVFWGSFGWAGFLGKIPNFRWKTSESQKGEGCAHFLLLNIMAFREVTLI